MDGFYINLNRRADRREHIETLIQTHPFFKNIERMEAICNERGDIGCSLSHIKCLTDLLQKNKAYYLILEDDFCILNETNFKNFECEFDLIKDSAEWDVLTLTPRGDTKIKNYLFNFNRIINNQTTTGYIVKHRFIETLLTHFKKGLSKLMNGGKPGTNALDQCWKPLQKNSNFIYYNHIFAGQLPGHSDIEQTYVDYNRRFIEQPNY